ncbi:MAG: ferredoxin [Bacilli bacterium]|jgi:ferredoxin|nr:ferredoxin [Bacilli bacterium]
MKKLKVNADNCIGCGLCVNMAPDAFALNDEGKSEAIAEMEDSAADEVVASCPVGAIEE